MLLKIKYQPGRLKGVSIEQSLCWEASSPSITQEIPLILENLKVHHRVHKISPIARVLSHTNRTHARPSLFFLIHVSSILIIKLF